MNKKLKNFFAVILALCVILFAMVPATVSAGSYNYIPVLTGKDLVLTNTTVPINYGTNGFQYYSFQEKTNVLSSSAYFMTNGVYGTNRYNYLYDKAWVDVPVVTDLNGASIQHELMIAVTGVNAASTNNLTFLWAKMPDGTNVATAGTGTWSTNFNVNGTTKVVFTCPIPAALTQGAQKLRLVSITPTAASGGSNYVVNSMGIIPPKY